MKRKQLEELGLQEEQIKKIMDLNGEDIQNAKDKASASNAEILEENEALKSQMSERDKDLKKLRSQVKDNEDLTKQFNDLKNKYDKDTADLTQKLATNRLNSAIDQSLSKANARNNKAVKGLLNMDEIKLDDDGNLTGLDDQIKSLQKSDGYLFDEGSKQDYQPNNGKPADVDPVQAMVDIFKGDVKNGN